LLAGEELLVGGEDWKAWPCLLHPFGINHSHGNVD
jgi:hypothetical protein